ncbi:MAG: hypothetical protein P0S93_05795, partial [Candidatus Neptunochlamydia sp.]|nr:hypothetical protein [Candidatus Neptunochlamydia sp.]
YKYGKIVKQKGFYMITLLSSYFSTHTHNFFPKKNETERDDSNLSNAARSVADFVRNNWKHFITAFLLYIFTAKTLTTLKGRGLVAFSSAAAGWTVYQGMNVWSLATAVPIIYGIARAIFNWATSPPTDQSQRSDADIFQQRRDQTQVCREQDRETFGRAWNEAELKLENQDWETFAFGRAWNEAERALSQHRAIEKQPDSVSVGVDQNHQEKNRPTTYTLSRPTDRYSGVITSPLVLAAPILHDTVDLEQDRDRDHVELTSPPSTTTTVAEEEEVVDTAAQQVNKKPEASDRAITEEKLTEARRILWEFSEIANRRQSQKIARLNPEHLIKELSFNREAFFNRMEVTLGQRIALLLPSVLTEAQKEKTSVKVKGLYLTATHFPVTTLFKYLELTLSQKAKLIGPLPQQLPKL